MCKTYIVHEDNLLEFELLITSVINEIRSGNDPSKCQESEDNVDLLLKIRMDAAECVFSGEAFKMKTSDYGGCVKCLFDNRFDCFIMVSLLSREEFCKLINEKYGLNITIL